MLDWGVCWTEGCVELRECGTEGYSSPFIAKRTSFHKLFLRNSSSNADNMNENSRRNNLDSREEILSDPLRDPQLGVLTDFESENFSLKPAKNAAEISSRQNSFRQAIYSLWNGVKIWNQFCNKCLGSSYNASIKSFSYRFSTTVPGKISNCIFRLNDKLYLSSVRPTFDVLRGCEARRAKFWIIFVIKFVELYNF